MNNVKCHPVEFPDALWVREMKRPYELFQASRKKISENNLAFVLISIVVMHFICHILRVFMAIYSVYLIRRVYGLI